MIRQTELPSSHRRADQGGGTSVKPNVPNSLSVTFLEKLLLVVALSAHRGEALLAHKGFPDRSRSAILAQRPTVTQTGVRENYAFLRLKYS